MLNVHEALKKQKEILEAEGYTVAFICLHGSQNYELEIFNEEYQSDIDIKAIIVPTLDELVRNSKPISIVVETEWGQCDIKDIRLYFQTLLKANPAYIETLFTKYFIVDDKFKEEFDTIFSKRDDLMKVLSAQFIRGIYGVMCEKEKALQHPYPSIAHKIEKYGYDGKQLHHIYRLWLMMIDYYYNKKPLSECLVPSKSYYNDLMSYKLNKPSLEEALAIVEKVMEEAKAFKDSILSTIDEKRMNYSVRDEFLGLSQTIIKNKIVIECQGGK